MGGGAVMRAAAKVAGFGISGGLRGATVTLPDQAVSAAARTVTRPIAGGLVSSTEDGKSGVVLSSQNRDVVEEGWEFAGGEEEMFATRDSINPVNRLVFGSAPSMEEAMEATSDLKEVLEKVSFTEDYTSLQSSAHSETKACVATENAVVKPSMPNPALQMFSLLERNSAALSVVAALTADKNIWDAVLQNEKVMEFLKQQQTSVPSTDVTDVNEDVNQPSENESYDFKKPDGNKFMDFIDNVKAKVAKMVTDVSEFVQNIFGGPTEGNIKLDGNGNAAANMTMGASFMALAVLSIMVVILKRG